MAISAFISKDDTITLKEAIKFLDIGGRSILIFTDENDVLQGILTDGDVRRTILSGGKLDSIVTNIINRNPKTATINDSTEHIEELLRKLRLTSIPLVDENNVIKDIFFLSKFDVFNEENKDIPVIIMAGGKGGRLEPFTKILPKPLIPIKGKPVVETIIDNFKHKGFQNFMLSVNYKKEFIKMYFQYNKFDFNVSFIEEPGKFLGTMGALSLARNKLKEDFFVINCDTLVNVDYDDIIQKHKENKNDLTIVACMKQTKIPYGVIDLDAQGNLAEVREKPEIHNLVIVGLYLINPSVMKYIPDNTYYDVTNLIEDLKADNKRIGIYPITEKKWFDVGQWEEYQTTLRKFDSIVKD